jgi:hypothetical protein
VGKRGATVLVLHHSGKAEGNLYRGSTEILAGVDIAFSMQKEKQQTRISGAPMPLTLTCIKHRYIEEQCLNLEFLTDRERFIFRDVTSDKTEEKEDARRETMTAVQEIICKLESERGEPNQTEVLQAVKKELDIGKNRALKILSQGKDSYWRSQPKDGSVRYQSLSRFPDTQGGGKPESLTMLEGSCQTLDL